MHGGHKNKGKKTEERNRRTQFCRVEKPTSTLSIIIIISDQFNCECVNLVSFFVWRQKEHFFFVKRLSRVPVASILWRRKKIVFCGDNDAIDNISIVIYNLQRTIES